MSRYISDISTTRVHFAPFIFIFLMFWGCSAFADQGYQITGRYYVPNLAKPGEYKEAAQWQISDSNEWVGFVNGLEELPRIDLGEDIIDPMALGNPEIIYFKQVNPDRISGNDIYLSKTGILRFAKMPVDTFFYKDSNFKMFLEKEMAEHPGYGEAVENSQIDTDAPGIVVIYRGSALLNNPSWVVKSDDTEKFKKYLAFIKGMRPMVGQETRRSEARNDIYDGVQTFILYLNYAGAKHKIVTLSPEGNIRTTSVKLKNYNYEDPKEYFKSFRDHGREIVKRDIELKKDPNAGMEANKDF